MSEEELEQGNDEGRLIIGSMWSVWQTIHCGGPITLEELRRLLPKVPSLDVIIRVMKGGCLVLEENGQLRGTTLAELTELTKLTASTAEKS